MKMTPMEQIKAAGDGLEVRERIGDYAAKGFSSIAEDDIERLKWVGLYQQRPEEDHRFMMRIRIPGGRLSIQQANTLADLAQTFAGGRLDLTTRQDVQLHNIRIEDVPTIFERLASVGLGTTHACGDVPRNVMACPLDADNPLIAEINNALEGKREFSNLPRKFKVGISTCPNDCVMARIHDVGLRGVNINGQEGFDLSVGGGLSTKPFFSQRLGVFLRPEEVVEVVTVIAEIFRDRGYRERRDRARLKFLLADRGPEEFRRSLEERLGRSLDSILPDEYRAVSGPLDHLGVLSEDKRGLAVPAGILQAEQLRDLADSAPKEIRLTPHQNILISGKIKGTGAFIFSSPDDWAGAVETCTGIDFCRRGLVHTKPVAMRLIEALNARCADGPRVRIHFTGCPNSCGRVQLAELGLSGRLIRDGETRKEAFELWFGCRLGPDPQFAKLSAWRIPAEEVPETVTQIIRVYQKAVQPSESFTEWIQRIGVAELRRLTSE